MSGLVSFLFLLVVLVLLVRCIGMFLRLVGEALSGDQRGGRGHDRPLPAGGSACLNPCCRRDNRPGARYCAQCGQVLGSPGGGFNPSLSPRGLRPATPCSWVRAR